MLRSLPSAAKQGWDADRLVWAFAGAFYANTAWFSTDYFQLVYQVCLRPQTPQSIAGGRVLKGLKKRTGNLTRGKKNSQDMQIPHCFIRWTSAVYITIVQIPPLFQLWCFRNTTTLNFKCSISMLFLCLLKKINKNIPEQFSPHKMFFFKKKKCSFNLKTNS